MFGVTSAICGPLGKNQWAIYLSTLIGTVRLSDPLIFLKALVVSSLPILFERWHVIVRSYFYCHSFDIGNSQCFKGICFHLSSVSEIIRSFLSVYVGITFNFFTAFQDIFQDTFQDTYKLISGPLVSRNEVVDCSVELDPPQKYFRVILLFQSNFLFPKAILIWHLNFFNSFRLNETWPIIVYKIWRCSHRTTNFLKYICPCSNIMHKSPDNRKENQKQAKSHYSFF